MGKIIRNGVVFGGGGSDDYTGTSAEVTEAIANGEIKNGMTVNITDDDDTETTLYNDIKEYIDNQINEKQNKLSMGYLSVTCTAGLNRVTSSTQLDSGTFPPVGPSSCIASITNHSLYESTKDVVTADGGNFFIFAEKAQRITIRWIAAI